MGAGRGGGSGLSCRVEGLGGRGQKGAPLTWCRDGQWGTEVPMLCLPLPAFPGFPNVTPWSSLSLSLTLDSLGSYLAASGKPPRLTPTVSSNSLAPPQV